MNIIKQGTAAWDREAYYPPDSGEWPVLNDATLTGAEFIYAGALHDDSPGVGKPTVFLIQLTDGRRFAAKPEQLGVRE